MRINRTIILELLFAVATLFVLYRLVYIYINNPCRVSPSTYRQNQLRVVSGLVRMYSDEHERFVFSPVQPGEFLSWAGFSGPDPAFGPDDTQDVVWMCPVPWPDRRLPDGIRQEELAQIPMLHERVDLNPDGTSVAFWDGHVELLINDEFERLIDVDKSACLACEFAQPNLMNHDGP